MPVFRNDATPSASRVGHGQCVYQRHREWASPVVAWIERRHLALELWRYGEYELWLRVITAPSATMDAIGGRAVWHLFHGTPRADGGSMLLDKAFALAAVEVIEGAARPLRRERRHPEKDFPGLPRVRGFVARNWLDRDATRARKRVERTVGGS